MSSEKRKTKHQSEPSAPRKTPKSERKAQYDRARLQIELSASEQTHLKIGARSESISSDSERDVKHKRKSIQMQPNVVRQLDFSDTEPPHKATKRETQQKSPRAQQRSQNRKSTDFIFTEPILSKMVTKTENTAFESKSEKKYKSPGKRFHSKVRRSLDFGDIELPHSKITTTSHCVKQKKKEETLKCEPVLSGYTVIDEWSAELCDKVSKILLTDKTDSISGGRRRLDSSLVTSESRDLHSAAIKTAPTSTSSLPVNTSAFRFGSSLDSCSIFAFTDSQTSHSEPISSDSLETISDNPNINNAEMVNIAQSTWSSPLVMSEDDQEFHDPNVDDIKIRPKSR